jgi:hypothetical protein
MKKISLNSFGYNFCSAGVHTTATGMGLALTAM